MPPGPFTLRLSVMSFYLGFFSLLENEFNHAGVEI